jgi:hypothetical protein
MIQFRLCLAGFVTVSVALWGAAEADAQWGSIKGLVVVDGDVPEIAALVKKGDQAVRDAEVCSKDGVPNEAIVVDPKTKGLANCAVYLRKKPSKIHPSLEKPSEVEVLYDQIGCKFVPHMIAVRTDQKVKVVSADAVAHNTRGTPLKPVNMAFNFVVPANSREGVAVPFKAAENLPLEIRCDLHPWMVGYWVVVDHPYAMITGADGTFELANVPVGKHELRIWHETALYVERSLEVEVKADGVVELKPYKVSVDKLMDGLKKK